MADCIFCKIIKGEIPSYTVYEDEKVKAFLDTNPKTNGHLLLVPKEHKKTILDMDRDTLGYMITIIQEKLYPILKEKLNIEGLTLSQNNFLGQDVPDFHIHLIPRYTNDNLTFLSNTNQLEKIEDVYEKLKDK